MPASIHTQPYTHEWPYDETMNRARVFLAKSHQLIQEAQTLPEGPANLDALMELYPIIVRILRGEKPQELCVELLTAAYAVVAWMNAYLVPDEDDEEQEETPTDGEDGMS